MSIGIIIIFHNNSDDIKPKIVVKNIASIIDAKICLVDNNSKDDTLEKILEVKKNCEHLVSVVQIKKKVSIESAKRAGARFMSNSFDLKHIGFIDVNEIKRLNYDLNDIIKSINLERDEIINFERKINQIQRVKSTLLKSVFSILDYFQSQDLKYN
ncbi:MAG: glycosyltransferase [Winogradskyella sp.]|uniref:glycosyltransferase n=1 Tax=Winogradskyella sp. TaxID=1883156 RepID=UPI000F41D9AC|nr:glycosyltransferase [Winogradskyella sp.]RNC86505.1 MAG: glycosyltransferase [Winogradskyella sp.]